MVFSAEVPLGGVKVYVEGVCAGSMNEGLPADRPAPAPDPTSAAVSMTSGEGCPQGPLV